ncbi:sulfotransferase domain-containing protein [Parerythrobacter lacustris]|uniref:Sulfotransferase domain-containing protein n=1 Tax=Parerythrobacter lacustris TaxID=2969984 RepID=A0ABT1XPP3_9SPHN|nr:sulfotransferase domain-containing protein [Parerythrobacter lacustris]MCR2833197.1 sulfotransferase domain-containing protein [Parerythrobacter lacustris]
MTPQAEYEPGRSIVWLASYPKSGSTWLRALLTACLCPEEPVDLNQLVGTAVVFERAQLDEHAAIDSAHHSLDELLAYQSDYHRAFAHDQQGPVFIKTHSAFRSTPDGIDLFPRSASAGAIVVVRNPLDIVGSYAHHEGKSADAIIARMADSEARQDAWDDRISKALPQRIADWSGNIASWLDQSAMPVCLVRYEDMLADTKAALIRVLEFSGIDLGDDTVQRAVEACSFARLSAAEAQGGFAEKPSQTRSFFRAGAGGQGIRELTALQASRIHADHCAVMERLGYAA